jgi:hypothetical protein
MQERRLAPDTMKTLRERFDAKWMPEPNSGCWLWIGVLDKSGYARTTINKSKHIASRVAWELYRGVIPKGICVCHHCDTPACVNPDHLFLGNRVDNNLDRDKKRRTKACIGEQHPKAKFTNNQIMEIRNDSRPFCVIAIDRGVTRSTIRRIKNRLTWKI